MRRPGARSMAVVVAGLVAWSAWFVARSTFVVDGQRYFSLFDDAMISMVYARNFVEGYGLNWARWGDPVEGFTCPLWTFLMIPVNALPLPLRLRSVVVQGLSLSLLCANLFVVRRLVQDHFTAEHARSWLPAVVLTATYFPLNHWSLMGMETALQANPDITGVLGINDAGNLGAYQALLNAGKTADDVFIFGIDCDPQAVALIDEGSMYKGCVNTNPEGTGVLAVDAYAKWLAGGTVPGILEVPVFVYTGS